MKRFVVFTLSAQMLVSPSFGASMPGLGESPVNCEGFLIQAVSDRKVAIAIAEVAKSIRSEVIGYGHDVRLVNAAIDRVIIDFQLRKSALMQTPSQLVTSALGREWQGLTPRAEVAMMMASRINPLNLNSLRSSRISPIEGEIEIHPPKYAVMRSILLAGGLNTTEAEAIRTKIAQNWHEMVHNGASVTTRYWR